MSTRRFIPHGRKHLIAAFVAPLLISIGVIFAAMTPVQAQTSDALTCSQAGHNLSWTNIGQGFNSVRLVHSSGSTSWVNTLPGQASTYIVSDPGASYVVRTSIGGSPIEAPCTPISIDLSCVQANGTLTWDSSNAPWQFVRRVLPGGSDQWVASVPNTTTSYTPDVVGDYFIRVWHGGQPFDNPCTETVATPPVFACSVQGWSINNESFEACLLYTSPSPRDRTRSRMPSSA